MNYLLPDKNKTLGERTVLFMENEMKNGVMEYSPKTYTSPRIREYFNVCTRIINGKEVPVGITAGNWCAAAVSFSLYESLLEGDKETHGFRVGVVEIVADLQKNNSYILSQDILSGKEKLSIGDVIIFDRSTPGKHETAWFRHIGRVVDFNNQGFTCISGNSVGGKYGVSKHLFTQPNLLGFGKCIKNVASNPHPINWNNIDPEILNPTIDSFDHFDYFETNVV